MDSNLLAYVQNSLKEGKQKEEIKKTLIENGWQESLVNEALNSSTDTMISQSSVQAASRKPQPEVNSIYSLLMSLVLTSALFVLGYRIISDVSEYYNSQISINLILNGLLIIPFFIVGITLHLLLADGTKRYTILSVPYYIVAAWYLISLLFKVSQYLMDANSTYGVYIVLLMIIVVLTGIILTVQYYWRES